MLLYPIIFGFVLAVNANSTEVENLRIIGGKDTTTVNYPYMVSIMVKGKHKCGGSIVSKHYVLTAAHCLDHSISDLSVRAGSTTIDQGGKVYRVSKIVAYTDDTRGRPARHDIALILVTEGFDIDSATQKKVELFGIGEHTSVGAKAEVTGWGVTKSGKYPKNLQVVTIPIVNVGVCNGPYAAHGGVTLGQLCAGVYGIGIKDSCEGDSGGPLIIRGRQAGIVSWGRSCGKPMFPGIYTDVAYYRVWIDRNIKE